MIKRIRNPHQADILYLQEPQTIAEYNPEIMDSLQSYTHKTHCIMLLHNIFRTSDNLSETLYQIVNDAIKEYPELAIEVRGRYPDIEFTGDLPLFDSNT